MKTITQLFFLIACSTVGFSQTVALIDFGSPNRTTGDNFNNVASGAEEDDSIVVDINDTDGNATGITLTVDDAFHGFNDAGTQDPDGDLPFPATATSDSFYGEDTPFNGVTQATGGFTLSGLDPQVVYSFEIFGSRTGVTDVRTTLYTVVGLTTADATLDAANNTENTAEISGVQPAADGTLTFTAETAADNTNGNGFYYLGALRMTTGTLSVNQAVLNSSLAIYPNPVASSAQITFDLEESANVKVDIYDLSGRLVDNVANGEQPAGTFTKTWNRPSNIASGVYILQIDADGKRFNSKLLLK
ncbi:MAG: T9SS type A sorting domain-containing protein [Leeuwenhoekiella sp.]